VPSASDSSDYFIAQMAYTLGGTTYTIDPSTGGAGRPAGFGVNGEPGPAVVDANRWGVGAFTTPGPTNQNEIQHNVTTGASEALTVNLGGRVQTVTTTFAQFYNPEPSSSGVERGRVAFYQTSAGSTVINTRATSNGDGGGGDSNNNNNGGAGNGNRFASNGVTEPQFRGRDPDTPGDAVYRTSRLENPYIEDPYQRSYSLGSSGVSSDQVSPAALAQIAPAAGPPLSRPLFPEDVDSDRSGQHSDRTLEPEYDLAAINIGPLEDLAAVLAAIAPAAGGTSTGNTAPLAPNCSSGAFMRDFWICYPPVPSASR
jgi:hypothetical protein